MFYLGYPSEIMETNLPGPAASHEVFPGACAQEDPGADPPQLLQGLGFGGDPSSTIRRPHVLAGNKLNDSWTCC